MATISISDVYAAQDKIMRGEITLDQYSEIVNAYNQQQQTGMLAQRDAGNGLESSDPVQPTPEPAPDPSTSSDRT